MSLYGKLLKQFIEFTGIKMYVVADTVGYDISYISKWCNKDYLPGSKSASKVNTELAKLFSADILLHHNLQQFCTHFATDSTEDKLESAIYDMLRKAYDRTEKKNSLESAGTAEEEIFRPVRTMIHSNEIVRFLSKDFQKYLELTESAPGQNEPNGAVPEVLCTLDICQFLEKKLPEMRFPEDREVHVRIAVQENVLYENRTVLLPKLYSWLCLHSKLNLSLYSNEKVSHSNIILVKGQVAAICSQDDRGHLIALTKVTAPETVQQIHSKLLPLFNRSRLLLHVSDPINFHRKGYRTDFYSRDHFQIMLALGFEFLLPRNCWEAIEESARKKYKNERIALLVRRLQVTWEEIFEHGSIDFFVLKTAVLRYIETGEVIFTDVVHCLTPAQRKSHIQNILEVTKKNPNIVFYLIDDEQFPVENQLAYMSIFNNRHKAFIKNPNRYHCDIGPFFYSVRSADFISNITAFFDEFKDSAACTRFGHKELAAYFEKYSALVNRMIDL